jgi:uncharacterized membrane protein YebE (DUF533 family)
VFGAFEEPIKRGLEANARAGIDSLYVGNQDKMQQVVDKAWNYHKRAHLHGGGIAAAALGVIVLLAATSRRHPRARGATALAMGCGTIGYSLYWLWAGQRAPALGSTAAAKESLAWLAVPSTGLLLLGLATAIVLIASDLFDKRA